MSEIKEVAMRMIWEKLIENSPSKNELKDKDIDHIKASLNALGIKVNFN